MVQVNDMSFAKFGADLYPVSDGALDVTANKFLPRGTYEGNSATLGVTDPSGNPVNLFLWMGPRLDTIGAAR